MSKSIKYSLLGLATLLVILVVYRNADNLPSFTRESTSHQAAIESSSDTASLRPAFVLPDLDGQPRDVREWDGKVIMLNFWATWCPPCRSEMPAFNQLYAEYQQQDFVILGIAIDTADSVQDFVDSMDIRYPILIAEDEGIKLAHTYGNRLSVLPYTVFIDREGKISQIFRQELSYEQAKAALTPLL